jgi:4-methoxybenzoate monooxygenase (O-demethylating)
MGASARWRLEAEAVLSALAARAARLEIAGDIAFRESTGLRALSSLPLRVVAK